MRYYIIISIVILLFINCKHNNEDYVDEYNKDRAYFKSEFIDHFPQDIREREFHGIQCTYVPFYYNVRFDLTVTISKSEYDSIYYFLNNNDIIKYNSNDTCLVIIERFRNNENKYKKDLFLTDQQRQILSRKCLHNNLPIPNFYRNYFATDLTESKLPNDFVLYVIDAKKGKYWDDRYLRGGENLPKEWEHGYSKGIALSEKRRIAIFWFNIW
jgi:hypothetical protein